MSRDSTSPLPGGVLTLLLLLLLLAPGCGGDADGPPASPSIRLLSQESGTTNLLQAVSVVDSLVVWISGHGGTWGRTVDGGTTWETRVMPGEDSLQFRDVHAVGPDTAFLLSAGSGPLSRIYRTDDGGASWTLQFRNEDPEAFFDCFDFWSPQRGVAFSDAVEGVFVILTTEDGGATWRRVPAEALPPAQLGEGSFAASGTCLVAEGERHAWVGTGAADTARILRTKDGGRSWDAVNLPIAGGGFAGITSVAFRDTLNGVVMGGNLGEPDLRRENVALTRDGGSRWVMGGESRLPGAIYGGVWVPGAPTPTLVAVGPGGADLSLEGGNPWIPLDTLPYWGLGFASPSAGWLVGPGGRITKVDLGLEEP